MRVFDKENMKGMDGVTKVWQLYKQGVNYNQMQNLYIDTEEAHLFFQGDQWHYMPHGQDRLPVENIIQPIVEYKTAMVALQNIQMVFIPMSHEEPKAELACDILGKYAAVKWEQLKMDTLTWRAIKDAGIAGDSYVYFYNKNLECEVLDRTQMYFADEKQPDIQKQEYIIVAERKTVAQIKRDARKNKISKNDIEQIKPDGNSEVFAGDRAEVHESNDFAKCTSLLLMWRDEEDGFIHFMRSTRNVVYEPEKVIKNSKLYPIASYKWVSKANSSRGVGIPKWLIPNQIAINRLLVQRLNSVKMNAFAKPVYDETKVENPADILTVGAPIKVRSGGVQRVKDMFDYIAPAPMSQEAPMLQAELLTQSKELASAGDAALGQIDPKRASGAAIIAVQDQAAIPLNEQVAMYKQFIEDIALIWIDMWKAYGERPFVYVQEKDEFGNDRLRKDSLDKFDDINMIIKIETSPTSPFSKYAREQAIQMLMQMQLISFDEYVGLLDEESVVPKGKLEALIQARQAAPASYQQVNSELEQGGDITQGKQFTQLPQAEGIAHQAASLATPTRATATAMPNAIREMSSL